MRIYRLAEFLTFPEGTLYCESEKGSYSFSSLRVKDETVTNPSYFWYRELNWIDIEDDLDQTQKYENMVQRGASVPVNGSIEKQLPPNPDALFLVYEYDDLCQLRAVIEGAMEASDKT